MFERLFGPTVIPDLVCNHPLQSYYTRVHEAYGPERRWGIGRVTCNGIKISFWILLRKGSFIQNFLRTHENCFLSLYVMPSSPRSHIFLQHIRISSIFTSGMARHFIHNFELEKAWKLLSSTGGARGFLSASLFITFLFLQISSRRMRLFF